MNPTKKKTQAKITKKMTFAQLISKFPEASEILFEKGMMCVGCPAAMQETLEQGIKAHGLNVEKIINELNKKLNKKKS